MILIHQKMTRQCQKYHSINKNSIIILTQLMILFQTANPPSRCKILNQDYQMEVF